MKIYYFFHQALGSICQRGSLHLSMLPRSGSQNPFQAACHCCTWHRNDIRPNLSGAISKKVRGAGEQATFLDVNTVLTDKVQAKNRLDAD